MINVNLIYPIGSIYLSINSTNPSKIFGGTWEQIKGRFLLGCGDNGDGYNYSSGSMGGSATNKHAHDRGGDGGSITNSSPSAGTYVIGDKNQVSSTTISIMPPYFACYIWYRTA